MRIIITLAICFWAQLTIGQTTIKVTEHYATADKKEVYYFNSDGLLIKNEVNSVKHIKTAAGMKVETRMLNSPFWSNTLVFSESKKDDMLKYRHLYTFEPFHKEGARRLHTKMYLGQQYKLSESTSNKDIFKSNQGTTLTLTYNQHGYVSVSEVNYSSGGTVIVTYTYEFL